MFPSKSNKEFSLVLIFVVNILIESFFITLEYMTNNGNTHGQISDLIRYNTTSGWLYFK